MSEPRINMTTAGRIGADDWPVLKLNEVDIERKSGARMGFEPRISHAEIYLPKSKVDQILVKALQGLILFDDEGNEDLGQQEERRHAIEAYLQLCDDGEESGPWLVRRGQEGPFYHAEGTDGLRWTASPKAAAKFEQKGRAEGLVSDLNDLPDEGLGFRPGQLVVVPLSSAR